MTYKIIFDTLTQEENNRIFDILMNIANRVDGAATIVNGDNDILYENIEQRRITNSDNYKIFLIYRDGYCEEEKIILDNDGYGFTEDEADNNIQTVLSQMDVVKIGYTKMDDEINWEQI